MQGKKLNKTCFLRMMTAWMLAVALAVPSVLAAETGQPPPAADAPALLAATAPSAAIISPQADPVKHPTITITQTLVQDDFGAYTGVVELALTVKTEVGEPFRSVGLNLVYDPYLIPCDWTGQGTAVTLGANQYATNLPALKSDVITAGMAMAGGAKGYLYLGAMADLATDLDGKAPLALVRFKYADKDALKLGPGGKIQYAKAIGGHAVGADANLISFVSETDPDCYRGSQAPQQLWYESGDKSYYYNNSTVPPVGTQIPGETPGITAPCPVTHGKVVYSKAGAVYSFETNRLPTAAAPADKGVYMAEAEGPTQNKSGGGVSLSDVAVLVFYDWDDTLLGVTVVSKQYPPKKLAAVIEEFNRQYYYNYVSKSDVDANGSLTATLPAGTVTQSYHADPARPLTNKKAYNFGGWVQTTTVGLKDAFTAYANTTDLNNAISDFSTMSMPATGWTDMILKAGYVAWDGIDKLNTNVFNPRYSVQNVSYAQYGASTTVRGNYGIKYDIGRNNADLVGVSRLKDPRLFVQLFSSDPNVEPSKLLFSLVEGADRLTGEVTVRKDVAKATITVIDYAESTNWMNATYRLDTQTVKAGTVSDPGFIYYGTLAYLAANAALYLNGGSKTEWNGITTALFADIGLDEKAQVGIPPVPAIRLSAAKYKMLLGFYGTKKPELTATELQTAINMVVGSITSDAALNAAKGKIDTAITANAGAPLTFNQIAYAINNNGGLGVP